MSFIEQYDQKKIHFLSHKKGWKKNNKSIALNFLYVSYNTEK